MGNVTAKFIASPDNQDGGKLELCVTITNPRVAQGLIWLFEERVNHQPQAHQTQEENPQDKRNNEIWTEAYYAENLKANPGLEDNTYRNWTSHRNSIIQSCREVVWNIAQGETVYTTTISNSWVVAFLMYCLVGETEYVTQQQRQTGVSHICRLSNEGGREVSVFYNSGTRRLMFKNQQVYMAFRDVCTFWGNKELINNE